VNGNPVNFTDPTGLLPKGPVLIAENTYVNTASDASTGLFSGSQRLPSSVQADRDSNIGLQDPLISPDDFVGLKGVATLGAGLLFGSIEVAGKDVASVVATKTLKPVVIGENMIDRVIPYAKEIGADVYKPVSQISENWMKNNKAWLNKMMKQGREIIDIGIDETRAIRSKFYEMEKKLLNDKNYPVGKP